MMLLVIRKQSEAAAMARWAVRIAHARESALHILWVESGSDHQSASDVVWDPWGSDLLDKEPQWEMIAEALADSGTLEIKLSKVNTRSRHLTALSVERDIYPELVIVGRHDSTKDGSMTGKLARELLDEAHSAVLVLRLSNLEDVEGQPLAPGILVPCAGGPHSRHGIRLVSAIAGKDATAFYVEPDADILSHEVGHAKLRSVIIRAGIDPETISAKVELSNDITHSIAKELQEGDYGMLLIGAASGGTLRRKLFGTVPERLINSDEGLCVGVIRSARPMGHRIKEKVARSLSLTIPQLDRAERIELFAEIEGKARWSFDFAVLMILSTAIAGLGLLADSAAVVIGAMLVAPMMTPLLGGGLSVVQGNWPLWKQCQKAVLLGFLSALCIGVILGGIARWVGMGITSELLARGEPTPLDMGVAFISGIAASYCLARPRLSSALAGVAIAAALVPPIATTGIALALGEHSIARGAALLFGANVVAIVLGSSLNFFMAGVRGKQATPRLWAQRLVIVLALVCAGLCVPLASYLVSKVSRAAPIEKELQITVTDKEFKVVSVKMIKKKKGSDYLEIHLEGPGFPPGGLVEQFRVIARKRYGDDVKIRIRVTLARDVTS